MNKLIEFFESNLRHSEDRNDALEVFENMVKASSNDDVLEASTRILVCPFGPDVLLERYKGGAINHENVREQYKALVNVVTQVGDTGYSNNEHINSICECVNYLQTTASILDSEGYIYEKAIKEFTENLEQIDRHIILEGTRTVLTEDNVMETILARTQAEFDLAFAKAFLGPEENFTLESMNELMLLSNRYDEVSNDRYVLEAQSRMKKAAIKMDEKAKYASMRMRQKASNANQTATIAKKAGGRFTGLVGDTLTKLNKMQKEERLEAVLQGGMRRRLSTLIRTAIMTGAASAIHPALGAMTLLTSATLHKRADGRLKQEMISEYEGELKLTREKIRDAEAAGDRKKKYDLMRIENHLEQNIERIKSPFRMNKPKMRKG